MPEEKNIYEWNEQLGNPYRHGLHPNMLLDDGYLLSTRLRVKGMSKSAEKIAVRVHFGRDYVVRWMLTQVLEKLCPASYNDFQAIVSQAWKEWKDAR